MVEALLSKRRVDPEKVDRLRGHFDALEDDRTLFERGLDLEDTYTEAAFLREDEDGPVRATSRRSRRCFFASHVDRE